MPGMDGLTSLREIKKSWPDIPVMITTAYGGDGRRRLAGERGATQFITKLVDFDHLNAQLRKLPGETARLPRKNTRSVAPATGTSLMIGEPGAVCCPRATATGEMAANTNASGNRENPI